MTAGAAVETATCYVPLLLFGLAVFLTMVGIIVLAGFLVAAKTLICSWATSPERAAAHEPPSPPSEREGESGGDESDYLPDSEPEDKDEGESETELQLLAARSALDKAMVDLARARAEVHALRAAYRRVVQSARSRAGAPWPPCTCGDSRWRHRRGDKGASATAGACKRAGCECAEYDPAPQPLDGDAGAQ